ncbi:MAG TPA: response regulator [Thermoanaerobaculia bacterium]|nr:response regulator [Thermoanaerobaculia bacterium]
MARTAVEVLIVEDDVQVQRLLTAILNLDGLTSVVAGDGKAALELLESSDFDAIVLDLMMPVLNGFDVLRHLSSANPAMLERTIVLTGASERMYRNSPQIRQARTLLRKPFDVAKLREEVAACRAAVSP